MQDVMWMVLRSGIRQLLFETLCMVEKSFLVCSRSLIDSSLIVLAKMVAEVNLSFELNRYG